MDIFAHALWTYAIYSKTPYALLAVIFGVFPDLVSFSLFFVKTLLKGNLNFKKPKVSSVPKYIFTIYDITHSLVIFFITTIIVGLLIKSIPWFMGGWLIHIVLDIPTHKTDFFPTPFLWPVSNYKFKRGTTWDSKKFLIINYTLILLVYIYIIFIRR